ncbi:DUF2813 domain-containing protein [Thaumasiovibrio sp. DFM-14]|uniref:DUF2813 domain-containing protein n=1 Tax=Thaumasiovibrio sp. DFM-14 TaxID=3384792 RepID=UPI0039A08211
MQLVRVEIANFRGIQRLSLSIEELTVLIGENAWGKSSLLDALDIFLSPHFESYQVKASDFHVDHGLKRQESQNLYIVLVWQEDYPGDKTARRYRAFSPFWQSGNAHGDQLLISMSAHQDANHHISTQYLFLDAEGGVIPCDEINSLLYKLRTLHPLVRIRDARRLRRVGALNNTNSESQQLRLEKRLNNTCRRLLNNPGHINSGELKSSINALHSLVEHYFAFTPHNRSESTYRDVFQSDTLSPLTWLQQSRLTKSQKLLMIGLLNAYIRARGPVTLRRLSRPILVLEDPEGRLHPTVLQQAWQFFSPLPIQKLVTTNSAELLGAMPLHCIRRLLRQQNGTEVFSLPKTLLSDDQKRRVEFHVRYHRPNALFARCWLLVEGETEIWLFGELARILGYHLPGEGIQLIDFAQSGLKPIIRTANHFGIEWHLITDGDPAGKKYVHTAEKLIGDTKSNTRITLLPERDIEHFLFKNGYEPLFRELANINPDIPLTPHKIILRALKRHAKPDVALAMIKYTEQQNNLDFIPVLLRWTLKRVIALARSQL